MGCLQSREICQPFSVENYPETIQHWDKIKSYTLPDLQVHTFHESCQGDAVCGDFSVTHMDASKRLFAASFNPIQQNSCAAAKFCMENCSRVFSDLVSKENHDFGRIFESFFLDLDREFFQSTITQKAKLESGCSGVICYTDFCNKKQYIANLGSSHCVIGWTAGSFNSKQYEGKLITRGCNTRSSDEQERVNSDFREFMASHSDPTNSNLEKKNQITKCIGCGGLKGMTGKGKQKKKLRDPSEMHVTARADVHEYSLTEHDEHIVLCTEGLLDVLSPLDVALYCSHFSFQKRLAMYHSFISPLEDGDLPGEDARLCSPASALVEHAAMKAWINSDSIHQEHHYRLSAHPKDAMHRTGKPLVPTRKRISAVVISLNWADSTCEMKFEKSLGPTKNQRPAIYRWHLVGLFRRYLIIRRRTLLRCWWTVVADAVSTLRSQRDQSATLHKDGQESENYYSFSSAPSGSAQESIHIVDTPQAATQMNSQVSSVTTCSRCPMAPRSDANTYLNPRLLAAPMPLPDSSSDSTSSLWLTPQVKHA